MLRGDLFVSGVSFLVANLEDELGTARSPPNSSAAEFCQMKAAPVSSDEFLLFTFNHLFTWVWTDARSAKGKRQDIPGFVLFLLPLVKTPYGNQQCFCTKPLLTK